MSNSGRTIEDSELGGLGILEQGLRKRKALELVSKPLGQQIHHLPLSVHIPQDRLYLSTVNLFQYVSHNSVRIGRWALDFLARAFQKNLSLRHFQNYAR